jgi:hypothetical protein
MRLRHSCNLRRSRREYGPQALRVNIPALEPEGIASLPCTRRILASYCLFYLQHAFRNSSVCNIPGANSLLTMLDSDQETAQHVSDESAS